MKRQQIIPAALALALVTAIAGCSKPAEPAQPAQDTPGALAEDVGAMPAPVAATDAPTAADGPRLDGYGPLRFGQDEAALRAAWAQPLEGEVKDEYCHSLRPQQAASAPVTVVFMVEGHQFVRYDVRDASVTAPGGGKVGMTTAELQALYPQRAELQPHKYLEKGKNLRVAPEQAGAGVLNFEIGDDGTATAWRVGLPPQVDYVEGCS